MDMHRQGRSNRRASQGGPGDHIPIRGGEGGAVRPRAATGLEDPTGMDHDPSPSGTCSRRNRGGALALPPECRPFPSALAGRESPPPRTFGAEVEGILRELYRWLHRYRKALKLVERSTGSGPMSAQMFTVASGGEYPPDGGLPAATHPRWSALPSRGDPRDGASAWWSRSPGWRSIGNGPPKAASSREGGGGDHPGNWCPHGSERECRHEDHSDERGVLPRPIARVPDRALPPQDSRRGGLLSDADIWWRPNETCQQHRQPDAAPGRQHPAMDRERGGGAPDQRDRAAEFARREPDSRTSCSTLLPRRCSRPMRCSPHRSRFARLNGVTVQGRQVTVLEAIYHVVEHFGMHTGQIIYIAKLRAGKRSRVLSKSSRGIPRAAWQGRPEGGSA